MTITDAGIPSAGTDLNTGAGALVATPHSHGAPVPRVVTGSPAERFSSADPDDFPVPTGREEDWRFSPIRELAELFQPFTPTGSLTGHTTAPAGVSAGPVPMTDPAVGRVLHPFDRVSALALTHSQQAYLVSIPAEAVLAEPVTVSAVGAPGLTYAHLVIEAGAFSQATVVINYTGSTTVAENVEIIVGEGARLTVISVQEWDLDAVHLSAHAAQVGRDATLSHVVVNLSGRIIRLNPSVRYAGPGGTAELSGLSFPGAGQHQECRLYVDHSVPNCTSDVLYKSVLQGETARTVWVGDVRIRPSATGTSTYELNRNLLLSDGARADSVPNLEIETGEIAGAGHASATGRFDELHLFYLQSRGIPEEQARRLVVRGFFADVLQRIKVTELRDRLAVIVDARLGGSE